MVQLTFSDRFQVLKFTNFRSFNFRLLFIILQKLIHINHEVEGNFFRVFKQLIILSLILNSSDVQEEKLWQSFNKGMPLHYLAIYLHIIVELFIQGEQNIIVLRIQNNSHEIRNSRAFHALNILNFLPIEKILDVLPLLYFRWTSLPLGKVLSCIHETFT